MYCLSIFPISCSSFAIVLSVHLSDLLLLICHCIVCPVLRFIAERWTDDTMTNEEQYIREMDRQYNDK
jgi:hypothetical protein